MKKSFVIAYICVAVFTFGHAWNRDYFKTDEAMGAQIMAAPIIAAVWPLYWSVIGWGYYLESNTELKHGEKNQ